MKFELKTENENFSKTFSSFFCVVFMIAVIITFCDIALKLGIISKHYQVNYNCSLLSIEKSKTNFKKLAGISKLKSKQQIWDFCREIVK
jgi:flagellar biosynthesis protein FlhB